MRIERINEKQIRCTLNQKDLSDREIGISEIAYGTDKAKALFRDMMQQASYEFGFEADDIPLMIEAIPMLPEALILVITKVEDPDELDTRFSRFSHEVDDESLDALDVIDIPDDSNDDDLGNTLYPMPDDAPDLDDVVDEFPDDNNRADENDDFISLSEALGMEPRPKTSEYNDKDPIIDVIKIYSFQNLDDLTHLSSHLSTRYQGQNTVYKDAKKGLYYLVLHKTDHSADEFRKVCNTVSEYGTLVKSTNASQYYYEEHFDPLISDKALQVLADI